MKANAHLIRLLSLVLPGVCSATSISYDVVNISGNTWQYDYSITNSTQSNSVGEFTIYFDLNDYSNLAVNSSPSNWNSIVVQPDANLPAAGFFDAQSLGNPLTLGTSSSGFTVDFTWLGAGSPGSQTFDIVDPNTFATLESGATVSATPVPLPGSVWLFCSGALLLLSVRISKLNGDTYLHRS